MPPTPNGDSGQADPPPQPDDTPADNPPPPNARSRPRELASALLAALLLTSVALGVWRAVALGADGLAAGTFILAAATLLSSGVIAFNRWQLRPGHAVLALLVAAALTASIGRWGQLYFANQPVDVTSQINWPADPDASPNTVTARLAVPKKLDSLDISVVLVNREPTAGDCGGTTFKVLRLGDLLPAELKAGTSEKARSGDTVTVRIPPKVKQVDLVLTVAPEGNCRVTTYIQLARFHNSRK
ncbi:hypothetical protein ACIA8O_31660 [Kitasatospora sp. NPDC051853]|uniref:hypothetical protein n=1 Tax=Kitasatospora sp. NPDC051853 TaxID=3364058 RepID=UPI0037B7BA8E